MRQVLIIAACCFALAAQAETKPAAPKAPVIPDALQAQFQKARADYDEATIQAKVANDAVKTAQDTINEKIKAMQETCGPLWQAQLDKDKNPFCAAKPAEAKK
jgi:hypothetical protein